MILPKRHGPSPFNKATSLLEISLCLCVVSVFLLVLIPSRSVIIAYAQELQIQNHLKAIGLACQQYHLETGQWPNQISDLQPYFLSSTVDNKVYTLNPQTNILTISSRSFSVTVAKPLFRSR